MAMALLANPIPLWDAVYMNGNAWSMSATGYVIDAANEKAAIIMQAPRTGTIDRIAFYVGAHTVGATLECEVQTVTSATFMLPTGTKVGSSTQATVTTTGVGWYEATLSTGADVTAGDWIALVVQQPGSGAGNCAISRLVSYFTGGTIGAPIGANYVSSWALGTGHPLIFGRYSDGAYGHCAINMPVHGVNAPTFNNASTPDEVGNRFVVSAPCRVMGARLFINPAAADRDYSIRLYDASNTLLASIAMDAARWAAGNLYPGVIYFTSTADLSAGTHRLTIRPDTASNIGYGDFDVASTVVGGGALNGIRYAMPGGVDTYKTSRTDAGSWTDDPTKFVMIEPLVIGFDDGAGGGTTISSRPGARFSA